MEVKIPAACSKISMNSAVSGFRIKIFRELPHRNTHIETYTDTYTHTHADMHTETYIETRTHTDIHKSYTDTHRATRT